ncbi:uncharacterized protein LOC111247791 isoform X2 [Varroa destructor]|uniref:Uncharacterized protein n=1 Tax=Varroa destructor TaxID=109461 RepID=A0A7M7JNQ9_VARDE|nr:uncharacterized protein LOC111247791 isoform X2 [Varroa destructor]
MSLEFVGVSRRQISNNSVFVLTETIDAQNVTLEELYQSVLVCQQVIYMKHWRGSKKKGPAMESLSVVLIIVLGISIGVVGVLIVVVFVWLQRKHTLTIPGSPTLSPIAFSTASSNRSVIGRWASGGVDSPEGGERDNRTFDREALQLATTKALPAEPPNKVGEGPDNTSRHAPDSVQMLNTYARKNLPCLPSSGNGLNDDLNIYSKVHHEPLPNQAGHSEHAPVRQGYQYDNISQLQNHGYVRPADVYPRMSVIVLPSADATRAADRNYTASVTYRDAVQATSFKYATPVKVTVLEVDTLLAKDSMRQYQVEGDISVASLSSIETQSDVSLVVDIKDTSRPTIGPPRDRSSEAAMFI